MDAMTDRTEDQALPLVGLRVLELGGFIAAPMAGRVLADFGAEVVKVERPGVGDELRRWRLHGGDTSLLFRTINRNKKSVVLDLSSDEGRQAALELARTCDLVVENFRPGTLEGWGLGLDSLRGVNPEIVLIRISGFGQTGPYRDRPGFGGVAEAVGGLRNLTGYPDRPPTRVGISLADSVAGLYAVIGALIALRNRDRGRGGDLVDVALYEAIYSLTESLIPDYVAFGVVPPRSGGGVPGIAPSNTYRCEDGRWVQVSGNSEAIFRRLMQLVGRTDLADDPSLADNTGRVQRMEELDAAIGAWTALHSHSRVLADLDRAGVPAGAIYTPEDIVADQHFVARGMLERHAVHIGDQEREVLFPGIVPRLERGAGLTRWLGRELGADTEEVLGDPNFNHSNVEGGGR
jgi:formyl-CoA transferase